MKCPDLKQPVLVICEMINGFFSDYSTKVSYNEEEARVFLANRVRYHDDTYILT